MTLHALTQNEQTAVDIERAFIGCCLLSSSAYAAAATAVNADQFIERWNTTIWQAMGELAAAGSPSNNVTLIGLLGNPEVAPSVTLSKYLASLITDQWCPPGYVLDFARQIREAWAKRCVAGLCDALKVDAQQPGSMPQTIIGDAMQALNDTLARMNPRRSGFKTMDQVSTRVIDKMARAYAGQKPEGLMSTGLRDLDHVLDGGFMPGDLVVMAGRPGMGKTLVASSMSRQAARADMAGGFYSMEMPDEQAMARLLADASFGRSHLQRIPSGHILKGKLSESDVNMVIDSARRLSDLPLYIDDTSSLSVGEVSARTRSLVERAQREGRRLGFIVIDYLKYLKASSQYRGQRHYEIGEICGGLKSLAKDLNIVVILLAQLNREVEKRDDKRPQLSDLRESGDIEADADTVLFLFREEYYLSKLEPKPGTPEHMDWQTKIESCHSRLEIIVAKQRSGPTDVVRVFCDPAASAVRDLGGHG
ncbi:DnaB-like helicase C-terminal domain-containing protein [Bradyrhizobium elkanii]|uniref:DnaB-like helicase C-terminal domain-containing protein n=1 Tax=Bradyrhizobium elkanii TaxID=29448 RepID=UPI003D2276F8